MENSHTKSRSLSLSLSYTPSSLSLSIPFFTTNLSLEPNTRRRFFFRGRRVKGPFVSWRGAQSIRGRARNSKPSQRTGKKRVKKRGRLLILAGGTVTYYFPSLRRSLSLSLSLFRSFSSFICLFLFAGAIGRTVWWLSKSQNYGISSTCCEILGQSAHLSLTHSLFGLDARA